MIGLSFPDFILLMVIFLIGAGLAWLLVQLGHFVMRRNHLLYGPVFIPSKNEDLQTMIELAQLKPGEKIVDVGSGDGKVVIALAKRSFVADGYENSPSLVFQSWWKIRQLGLQQKAHIYWQDFWQINFAEYDVIMMYTSKDTMEKLEQKIRSELRPGARVVSNTFVFPNWEVVKKKGKIFVYKK